MKKTLPFILSASLFIACAGDASNSPKSKPSLAADSVSDDDPTNRSSTIANAPFPEAMLTVSSADDIPDGRTAILTAADGERYKIAYEPEVEEIEMLPEGGNSKSRLENKACTGEYFDGSERGTAKVSSPNVPTQIFPDLAAFLNARNLPTDIQMLTRIPRNGDPPRIKEENRNVEIDAAWLYAFARQSDEDYHLIIGTTSDPTTAKFMNVEISGLSKPGAANFSQLQNARAKFVRQFGIDKCRSGYVASFKGRPAFLRLKGSMFFDIFHYDPNYSNIGHGDIKPRTYWEIHPITDIDFAPRR